MLSLHKGSAFVAPDRSAVSWRRFWNARSGIAATEFALLFPVLLLLLLGGYELARAAAMMTRTTYLANNLAELFSQSTATLDAHEIRRIYETAPLMNPDLLAHARTTGRTDFWSVAKVTISSVQFTKSRPNCTSNCTYKADLIFSTHFNHHRRLCGSVPIGNHPSQIPPKAVGEGSLVVVDVAVPYQPLLFTFLSGPFEFKRTVYLRPRYVDRVNYTGNCPGF